MGMTIDTPFIAHSELTDEIYVIDKNAKYCVTDQVMKAVVATNRAIPKDQYETRLKADMVAMLTDIQLEIEGIDLKDSVPDYQKGADETREYIADLLQQKIDALIVAPRHNEQDIVKPYLDKLKEKIITNTERFSLSRESHGLGEVEWSEYLIPNYKVVELIDNLLSEQGDTE